MAELIEFPPADEAIWLHLRPLVTADVRFPGAQTGGFIPKQRPPFFVRVRLAGGSPVLLNQAQQTVLVESYATKYEDAKKLAFACEAWLSQASRDGWLGLVPFTALDIVSRPADLPDPLTDQARFTATYAVTVRGAAALTPENL